MNPLFHTEFSISDSLKNVRKSVLIYETIIDIYLFLLKYVKQENAVCINITHNLADIEYMPGSYYLLANKTISQISDKEKIIEMYVKGGMI